MLSSSRIHASWAPADAGGGRRPGADAKGRASARGSGVWVTHGGYGIRYCCRTRSASSRPRTPRRALLSRSRTRSAYNSRNRRRFRNRRPPSTLTYNSSEEQSGAGRNEVKAGMLRTCVIVLHTRSGGHLPCARTRHDFDPPVLAEPSAVGWPI